MKIVQIQMILMLSYGVIPFLSQYPIVFSLSKIVVERNFFLLETEAGIALYQRAGV